MTIVLSILKNTLTFQKYTLQARNPLSILTGKTVGVFYPLQTFNKDIAVSFNSIPICAESSESDFFSVLKNIAQSILKKLSN